MEKNNNFYRSATLYLGIITALLCLGVGLLCNIVIKLQRQYNFLTEQTFCMQRQQYEGGSCQFEQDEDGSYSWYYLPYTEYTGEQ